MNALNLGNGGHWQKCKRGNESWRTGMRSLRNKTVLLLFFMLKAFRYLACKKWYGSLCSLKKLSEKKNKCLEIAINIISSSGTKKHHYRSTWSRSSNRKPSFKVL